MVTLRRLVWRESGIKNCRSEKIMMMMTMTKKPFLEAQKANFDKSQNPNQSEFRHPVFGSVLPRTRSVRKYRKSRMKWKGTWWKMGAKMAYYRVDYNSTRSAAPKSGGGAAPAFAVAGYTEGYKEGSHLFDQSVPCNRLCSRRFLWNKYSRYYAQVCVYQPRSFIFLYIL